MKALADALRAHLPEDEFFVIEQNGEVIVIRQFRDQPRAPRLLTFSPRLDDPEKVFYIEAEDSEGTTVVV